MMTARPLIGIALICLAIVGLDAAGLPIAPFRVAAGVVVAMFMPGAAVMLLVRPRFLADSARLVLSVPISIAILALVGVVLDWTPWGLRPLPLVLASAVVTLALLAIAARSEAAAVTRNPQTGPGR